MYVGQGTRSERCRRAAPSPVINPDVHLGVQSGFIKNTYTTYFTLHTYLILAKMRVNTRASTVCGGLSCHGGATTKQPCHLS